MSTAFETSRTQTAPGLSSSHTALGTMPGLCIAGATKKTEYKYALSPQDLVKYASGHSDLAGIDNYYLPKPYAKDQDYCRQVKWIKGTEAQHSFMDKQIKRDAFKPAGNSYYPKKAGDIETKKSDIRNFVAKAPRKTITEEYSGRRSFIPCSNEYKT